jgi:hypothetical protein
MSTPSPSARTYKRLGYLALAHAVALFGLAALVLQSSGLGWFRDLWVGMSTLWFLWPIVLVLHPGRSALRLAVFALLSAVLLFPSLLFYDRIAPDAFGLPDGARMNPLSAWMYFNAYHAGQIEAKRDIAAGILVIEQFGLGAAGGEANRILRERYHVEPRAIAGCFVDEKILGHAAGYNSVSEPEIDRKIGRDKIEAAREEGARLDREAHARSEQRHLDLAKQLSIFPADSNIVLESVAPYPDSYPGLPSDIAEDLGPFVRSVEQFLRDRIPKDALPFTLQISAFLSRSERPKFQTSASFSAPRLVCDKIYQEIEALPVPQWDKADVSVGLDFVIRQKP